MKAGGADRVLEHQSPARYPLRERRSLMSAVTHTRLVMRGALAALGAVTVAVAFEVRTYRRWRPWCLSWGATESEAARRLPGDNLLADAGIVSTRAVQVDAPPSAIWPWLVQMGR